MLKEDMEREKKQADEELAGVLRELVIQPIDELLEERVRNSLFDLEHNIEAKLKKQLVAVSKAKKLEEGINGLEDNLQNVGFRLNARLAEITQQLNKTKTDLDESHQQLGTQFDLLKSQLVSSERVHTVYASDLISNLKNHSNYIDHQIGVLKSELSLNQEVVLEKAQYIHTEFKILLKEINEKLESSHFGISQILKEQSVVNIENINSTAKDLRQDLSVLQRQSIYTVDCIEFIKESLQQQQLLLDIQQKEIKHFRQSMVRFIWLFFILFFLALLAIIQLPR